jgi:hypothetical protein
MFALAPALAQGSPGLIPAVGVIVRVFSCLNTDKSALTMVAGRIAVKAKPAPKKPSPRKPDAGKTTKR